MIGEVEVRAFFARYERLTAEALAGAPDLEAAAALYAPEFIASTPAGLMTGRNDAALREALAGGFARQRGIGAKAMRIRALSVSPMDAHHCVVRVSWTAIYARAEGELAIDFDVHYFLRALADGPKVFGWASGDEEALLREHGIL